jgi:hypothetical protein
MQAGIDFHMLLCGLPPILSQIYRMAVIQIHLAFAAGVFL